MVPDNPKVSVTKPCRYDPELIPIYQKMAHHYRLAFYPHKRNCRNRTLSKIQNLWGRIQITTASKIATWTKHRGTFKTKRDLKPLKV